MMLQPAYLHKLSEGSGVNFMGNKYVLYIPTVKGIYQSKDQGSTWKIFGPESICIKNIAVNQSGHIFAIGEISDASSDIHQSRRGLFIFSKTKKSWLETKLFERLSKDTGFAQTPTGALAVVKDMVLVGTGCGVWGCTNEGKRFLPIGPGLTTVQKTIKFGLIVSGAAVVLGLILAIATLANITWLVSNHLIAVISSVSVLLSAFGLKNFRARLGPRLSFGETFPIYSLAVSHSYYGQGELEYPFVAMASCDKIYYCNMDDYLGVRSWYPPDPLPDNTLNNLIEFGSDIAAWTSNGVFIQSNGRDWGMLNETGVPIYCEHLIAASKSPDEKYIWCTNGAQMFRDKNEPKENNRSWQLVWDEALFEKQLSFTFAYDSSALVVTPPVFSPFYKDDGMAFAVSFRHGVIRSTDGGCKWDQSNNGITSRISAPIIIATRYM